MCVYNHLPFLKHLSVAVTNEVVAAHSQASKCLDSYKCNYLLPQAVEETGLSRGQIQSLFFRLRGMTANETLTSRTETSHCLMQLFLSDLVV